jgi:hypothetical protein
MSNAYEVVNTSPQRLSLAIKCLRGVVRRVVIEGSTLTPGVSNTGGLFPSSLDCCTDLFADGVYINHRFILQ